MTSITRWVVLWKLRIGFGVIPQLQRVIISALFLEQFCVPSSRYGRRDSLQFVGNPLAHSIAILVSSWASNVCVLSYVSLLDVLICWVKHQPKCCIGRMLVVWLWDRLHEKLVLVCWTRDKWNLWRPDCWASRSMWVRTVSLSIAKVVFLEFCLWVSGNVCGGLLCGYLLHWTLQLALRRGRFWTACAVVVLCV